MAWPGDPIRHISGPSLPARAALWSLPLAMLLSLASAAHADVPSPAGFSIDESGCASGGPTTSFFADGSVVKEDCGDDCPSILEGTWKLSGTTITVQYTRAFYGKGDKPAPGPTPARTIYENYAGVSKPVTTTETIEWTGTDAGEGCETIVRHKATPGARAALKGSFVASWPELSARELTRDELAGRSKKELALMRNEIFASYGYIFKKAEYKRHFGAVKGYQARFTDVSQFLSPIEHKNVALIKELEK